MIQVYQKGELVVGARTRNTRVALCDDRSSALEALRGALEATGRLELVGAYVHAEAMLDALAGKPPDVALIAVSPHRDALDSVRRVRARWPAVKIAMLADAPDPSIVKFAISHRIEALLLTTSPSEGIATAVQQVMLGQTVLPHGWQPLANGAPTADQSLESLSSRQRQVLEMVAAGASNEEVAERLFISVNTVKFHLRSIYARLGIHNRVQAARVVSGMRPGGRRASDRLLDH